MQDDKQAQEKWYHYQQMIIIIDVTILAEVQAFVYIP